MRDPAPPDPTGPPGPYRPEPEPGQGPGRGSVGPSRSGPLVVLGCVAALAGWAVRPIAVGLDRAVPLVTWWTVGPIWLLALVVGAVALRTWLLLQRPVPGRDARGVRQAQQARRQIERRARLTSYQAVNRMVLGKSAALVGAVVLGGYAGFAVSQVGMGTELSDARLLRAAAAAGGGLLLLLMGLVLERACRVRSDAG